MTNFCNRISSFIIITVLTIASVQAQVNQTDLLIIGGGASGTAAAIQASRMGIKTTLIEETEWLGGMLTSAGVSAIDGNHNLPSGIWGEFRQKLADYYGGSKALETGWVSNTLFEPSVANEVLKAMAQNNNLTIIYRAKWLSVKKNRNVWHTVYSSDGKSNAINSKLIIDATELGDVMAYLKIPYRLGMDSRVDTHEPVAPENSNSIVQDITYVITLKDYGKNADKTIPKPAGYDPAEFNCACDISDPSQTDQTTPSNCDKMLAYGKLPNQKYMINWPKCGNDIYLNIIEQDRNSREAALKKAKLHSLRFIYYIQTKLGYKNLGLADDEYPTADHLPMIPYYRESRRLIGKVTLTANDMAEPYHQKTALYRTGIAVGDYPIDHHHAKNTEAPKLEFIKIKIPSYNIPVGSLIPQHTEGIIIAEKSISVTNIAAGTTRLQPVVLEVGQAAGALAAIAISTNKPLSKINIRQVQSALLDSHAYLMPYIDVKPDDKNFKAIQRIGATGILKGTGIPYKWANQTWFYPERPISQVELLEGFKSFYSNNIKLSPSEKFTGVEFCSKLFTSLDKQKITADDLVAYIKQQKVNDDPQNLSRRTISVLIDHFLNPFSIKVNLYGQPQVEN